MKRTLSRIINCTIVLTLLLSMPFTMGAQAASETFTTTAGVNMRETASADSTVVSVVQEGVAVAMLDHNPAGWSRVQVGSATGFIRSDFLRLSQSGTFRTTAGVNIRESGSETASVLGTVTVGSNVEVLEHNPAGWSQVRAGDITGFIKSVFLAHNGTGGAAQPEQETTTDSAPDTPEFTVIATMRTTTNVNFRMEPSTSASIIRTLARDTSVEVLENQSNGWSRIRHSGTVGFVDSNFLTDAAQASGNGNGNGSGTTLRTTGGVNLRASASTTANVIRILDRGTSVELTEAQSNGWSRVRHNGSEGFIRSDLLTDGPVEATTTLRTNGTVNLRAGPSTDSARLDRLGPGTPVEVISANSNGWSSVRVAGQEGFIRSDLLSVSGGGGGRVELLTWQEARPHIPMRTDMRVVDVRTGITFNLRAFSLGGHADVEPPTRADTEAISRSRNGVWAWAPRPVWVTIGDRTFAAALNGMPHGGSTISGNGMDGHLCLHFAGTVTRSQSYQRALRAAVQEAFDARPR